MEEEQDALTSGPTRSERGIGEAQLSADGMKGEGRARARPEPDCWAEERKEWAA